MNLPSHAQLVVMLDCLLNTNGGLNQHYCESIGQATVYQASKGCLEAARAVHDMLTPHLTREAVEASVAGKIKNNSDPARLWVSGCLQAYREGQDECVEQLNK